MTHLVQLNDAPLEFVDPELLTATSYGHFTSMQVRDGRVRGLDLHLERLDHSSRELFGHGVSADRVLGYLRTALARSASGDVSLRVTAFSRDRAFLAGTPVEPDLLITTTDPIEPTGEPPRLLAVEHERAAPHLKHTGTFSLTHEIRRARLAGYDNALFYDRRGRVSEASIWNICFATDDRIVWPAADVLPGITMLTLQAGLDAITVARETVDISLSAVSGYRAAYLTNSIDPALPVASITTPAGTTQYEPDSRSAALIATAYDAIPPQKI
ncbi:aminotransferase class IV [Kribbella sp. CA-294648]|uniref:aminotransferase class IV n=1 Tax=Kribbella sp. CA-294648 TaxID=3239948 RepID=UPI003D937912